MNRRHFLQLTTTSLAATLTLQPAQSIARSPRKFALLIGINNYQRPNQEDITPLKGCANDVALLKNLLQYRYNFPETAIVTLIDRAATRAAILTQLKTLTETAQPDDIVVISFSGHGARLTDPNPIAVGGEKRPTTTGLLPYDATLTANQECNYITGTTLFLIRSAFKTQNLTVILDCCYAGGGTRGDSIGRSASRSEDEGYQSNPAELQEQTNWTNQLNWTPKILQTNRQNNLGPKGVILAAAEFYQTARDSTFSEVYHAGAFTKFLTEALWAKDNTLVGLEAAVNQSLLKFAGKYEDAQTPVFEYPTNRQPFLPLFTPKLPVPAQGSIIAVDRTNRQLKIWLGGLPYLSLTASQDTEFRLLDATGRATDTRITLNGPIAPDFQATATIPSNVPLPQPGTLLQQYYRPLPKDLILRVGIDPTLGNIRLQGLDRIQSVPAQANGGFSGVDIILGKITPADQLLTNSPTLGSYGLFTSQRSFLPNTFGPQNETLEQAITRLQPLLKVALVKKVFRSLAATAQEIENNAALTASIVLESDSSQIVSLPNQIKGVIPVGETIEIKIQNRSDQQFNIIIVGIDPNGNLGVSAMQLGSQPLSKQLPIDGSNGIGLGEIMVMASQAPLALFQDYLTELAETFRKNPSVATNRSNRSTANSLQEVLLRPLEEMARSRSRTKTDMPDMLVIALPVQIQSR